MVYGQPQNRIYGGNKMKIKIVKLDESMFRYGKNTYKSLIGQTFEVVEELLKYVIIHDPLINSHAPWSKIVLSKLDVEVVEK